MAPELIIFDCDGVLVDSEILSCRCLSDVLRVHGEDLPLEQVMRLFLGRSRKDMLQYFSDLGRPLPPEFSVVLQERVREVFTSNLRAVDGILELLDQLEVPFCVASSSDPVRLSLSLRVAGLSQYFGDRWFSSTSVKASKPAPDLFLHAAEVIGVPTDKILVIEDSLNGVLAAKAAGMAVWGFVGGSHCQIMSNIPALQSAGAGRIVQNMPELAEAIRDLRV